MIKAEDFIHPEAKTVPLRMGSIQMVVIRTIAVRVSDILKCGQSPKCKAMTFGIEQATHGQGCQNCGSPIDNGWAYRNTMGERLNK